MYCWAVDTNNFLTNGPTLCHGEARTISQHLGAGGLTITSGHDEMVLVPAAPELVAGSVIVGAATSGAMNWPADTNMIITVCP